MIIVVISVCVSGVEVIVAMDFVIGVNYPLIQIQLPSMIPKDLPTSLHNPSHLQSISKIALIVEIRWEIIHFVNDVFAKNVGLLMDFACVALLKSETHLLIQIFKTISATFLRIHLSKNRVIKISMIHRSKML